jgi:inorganic pyrophosphatase
MTRKEITTKEDLMKIIELSRENEKLSKKKKELETKLIKLDKLEKLQEWLPQELKDLFEKYLQEQEKSRTRGKKIIKTWQEKLEDEKEQRQSKGIER